MRTTIPKLLLALSALFATGEIRAEMRITTPDAMKAVTSKEAPQYPPIAKQMKVTGRVEVEVSISTDGSVDSVKVLSGNALLTAAAVTAVKKWKFNPFAEKAVTVIGFDFKM